MLKKSKLSVDLKNKSALISGGSSGIGGSIANSLINSGCKVGIFSRDIKKLEKFRSSQKKELRNNIYIYEYDATQNDQILEMFEFFTSKLTKIDILINNVGGGGRWGKQNFEDTDFFTWKEVFNKNYEICYQLTMKSMKQMIRSKWGRVITISSIYGTEYGGRPWFNSAKAAQIALMKNLSHYEKATKNNITFNTISPGATFTENSGWDKLKNDNLKKFMNLEKKIPSGKIGTPEDIANFAMYLCSSFSNNINGANIVIDGGESISY